MKTNTEAKTKWKRLKRRLNLPRYAINGILETMWQVALANTPDGAIGRLSNEDIAAELEWGGDSEELINALRDGWLDDAPPALGRLVVHDWSDHCPKYIKGNLANAGKRCADLVLAEWRQAQTNSGGTNSLGTNSQGTVPIILNSIQAKPINTIAQSGDSATHEPDPDDPFILEIPVTSPADNKQYFRLTDSKVKEYEQTFSSLDVVAECRKARQWCIDNPSRQKTARGMGRFLFSWLERANNSGRGAKKPLDDTLPFEAPPQYNADGYIPMSYE